MASEDNDFDFTTWSSELGLSDKTVKQLKRENCDKFSSLKTLQLKDVMELGLTIGDRNLVLKAVKDMNEPTQQQPIVGAPPEGEQGSNVDLLGEAGNTFDNPESLRALAKQLQDLGGSAIGDNGSKTKQSRKPASALSMGVSDPRLVLTMKASSAVKAVHITQFLTEKTKNRIKDRQKRVVLGNSQEGRDEVVLLKENRHPYSGISVSEWGAANTRLLNHLLSEGTLDRGDVEFYLAYTTMIFEYVDSYAWESILDFDYMYRERQAEHGFQWGIIPANMELSLLCQQRPKVGQQAQGHGRSNQYKFNQANRQTGQFGRASQGEEKPVPECRLFKTNNGYCPFGDECKFRHVKAERPGQAAQKGGSNP